MSKVIDLDILRPESVVVKLGGKEVDLSFVPCGITFEVDEITRELFAMDQEKVKAGGEETRKAFDLTVKLCALFCTVQHKELNEEFFRTRANANQVNQIAALITDALKESYRAIEAYGKNGAGANRGSSG